MKKISVLILIVCLCVFFVDCANTDKDDNLKHIFKNEQLMETFKEFLDTAHIPRRERDSKFNIKEAYNIYINFDSCISNKTYCIFSYTLDEENFGIGKYEYKTNYKNKRIAISIDDSLWFSKYGAKYFDKSLFKYEPHISDEDILDDAIDTRILECIWFWSNDSFIYNKTLMMKKR